MPLLTVASPIMAHWIRIMIRSQTFGSDSIFNPNRTNVCIFSFSSAVYALSIPKACSMRIPLDDERQSDSTFTVRRDRRQSTSSHT